MMSQQIKDAFKEIENITAQVENNLDNGANTQQLVKYSLIFPLLSFPIIYINIL